VRRDQEGEGGPSIGGLAVRLGPDQQRPRPAAQHHSGGPDPGHLLQGHVCPGAVAHLRPGPHPEGHLGCALLQRRASHPPQTGEGGGRDRGLRQLGVHHGGQCAQVVFGEFLFSSTTSISEKGGRIF